ncbi:hypothetical protein QBC34DRAFT_66931 [Podospora aff. communis PSN243]|uniref:Uncharacterized protein n=1 Tax=Podospora aff. communis PSN243 TaxID=3040156 RepID=A0AAV9H3P5_9PEZI|nr:hypothetical protein QBC34DRAFT_66931 [Podospora aff. communis PSN243]
MATIVSNITLGQIPFTHDCEGAVKIYAALQIVPPVGRDAYPGPPFREIYAKTVTNTPFPYDEFITIIRSVKPEPFLRLSNGVIVDWLDNLNINTSDFSTAVSQINSTCLPEYCRGLAWQGNPDLAGVGAFASYTIGVALAVIFTLAILSCHLFSLAFNQNNSHNITLPPSFLTSFTLFWDSAYLFNLAVTIAAAISLSENTSLYNQEFTRLSASISWSVIASTWPLYAPICRYPKVRRIAIWAATVGYIIISATVMAKAKLGVTVFENGCLDSYKARSWAGRTVGVMEEAVVMEMQILGFCFSCWYFWKGMWNVIAARIWRRGRGRERKGAGRWPWVSRRDSVWRRRGRVLCGAAWSAFLCLGMIACLVTFALKREMTAEVAGPSLEESKWGFGQVMALTTWLPTVVDFLLVLKGECSRLCCCLVLRCALLAN